MAIFNSLCSSLDEMLEKYPNNATIVVDVFINQMKHSRWMNEQIIEVLSQFKYYDQPEIRQIIITSIKELNNSEQW